MTKQTIQLVILAVVLLLLQVVFSKIVLWHIATPIVFIYLILRLPIGMSANWVYTIAFVMGLIVDVFNNTQGMNALSCTLISAIRRNVFNAFVTRDDDVSNPLPSQSSMGSGSYFKYMSTLVLIYCVILMFVQVFTFSHFGATMVRAIASGALSILMIYAIDTIVSTRREKRL